MNFFLFDGSALELQGSLSISGEPLIIQGQGASGTPNVPLNWFEVGPAPINNGQDAGNQAVSGRVTGVAVNPTDPNVIYISTAGGGAWKTKDGGLIWVPLFDATTATVSGLPNPVLFSGSVGRTDLLGGDWDTLVSSIRTMGERFPPDTVVYSGHGPETTLGAELARNPFLSELRA